MEVVADGEPGQGPQEQCLYGDILGTILSHADGYALGRVLAVCSEWRAQGTDDSLWRRMCFGRWNLVDLRIFLDLLDLVPVASAFAAFLAFASPACREGGCGSAEWPQEWPRRERGAG